MTVTYLYDVDGMVVAARLKCVPDRGTFPAFSWHLNHSSLPAEGDAHAVTHHSQILILTDVSDGFYRCRARDRFNHSSVWVESEDIFIEKTGEHVLHIQSMSRKMQKWMRVVFALVQIWQRRPWRSLRWFSVGSCRL